MVEDSHNGRSLSAPTRLLLLVALLILGAGKCIAQKASLQKAIDSLASARDLPFDDDEKWWRDCGDEQFWKVVKYGKPAINALVNRLSDTAITNVRFQDADTTLLLRNGDLAYACLRQIVFLPLFEITKNQWHTGLKGIYRYGFFSWLSKYKNRLRFQGQVRTYLHNSKRTWHAFADGDVNSCQRTRGILGSYE
jgi:hypothetical protein